MFIVIHSVFIALRSFCFSFINFYVNRRYIPSASHNVVYTFLFFYVKMRKVILNFNMLRKLTMANCDKCVYFLGFPKPSVFSMACCGRVTSHPYPIRGKLARAHAHTCAYIIRQYIFRNHIIIKINTLLLIFKFQL